MSGQLLIIAGFSCTGKTTYINAAHNFFGKRIGYRNFYTNRLPRSHKECMESPDYKFVTNSKYDDLSNQLSWHGVRWYDFYYGFYIHQEITYLKEGGTIMVGTPPHTSYLADMQEIHGHANITSIFLNVPYSVIRSRLNKRPPHERTRIREFNQNKIDNYAKIADIVFTPKNEIVTDCKEFLAIIARLLSIRNCKF